jgi:ribosomal protein L37AE/L43A
VKKMARLELGYGTEELFWFQCPECKVKMQATDAWDCSQCHVEAEPCEPPANPTFTRRR